MKGRLILRIVILAVLLGGAGMAVFQTFSTGPQTVEAGVKAPDFQLKTMEGETIRLSDLRGKGVMVNFWGFWCEPCEEEMPHIESVYQEFKDHPNVAILAVHVQKGGIPVQRFVEKYDLHFPILIDEQREVTQLYDIDEIPTTYFIDPEGVIQERLIWGPLPEETIRQNLLSVMP